MKKLCRSWRQIKHLNWKINSSRYKIDLFKIIEAYETFENGLQKRVMVALVSCALLLHRNFRQHCHAAFCRWLVCNSAKGELDASNVGFSSGVVHFVRNDRCIWLVSFYFSKIIAKRSHSSHLFSPVRIKWGLVFFVFLFQKSNSEPNRSLSARSFNRGNIPNCLAYF